MYMQNKWADKIVSMFDIAAQMPIYPKIMSWVNDYNAVESLLAV